ncbi:hypothetical protein CVT24_007945, partial [Panaeolus cyanescens]
MANSNRQRRAQEGGAVSISIPFAGDDFNTIQATEAEVVRKSKSNNPSTGIVKTANDAPIVISDDAWASASSWSALDSTEFALDPANSAWYDEELQRGVMDEPRPPNLVSAGKKKKKRSDVSTKPNVVWKHLYLSSYLDEILRHSGRGDFVAESCNDCVALKRPQIGKAEYRCSSECFLQDLTCKDCCVRRHKRLPLHRIQKWNGTTFESVSLKSLGLRVQLGHASMKCTVPLVCHSNMTVLHTNGMHEVCFEYCSCGKGTPIHIQLLRRRFYPATQLVIKTCATFELLRLLHKISLTTKCGMYDLYRALEKVTNSTGVGKPKSLYRTLYRMFLQWCHLHMMKWAGRAHDPGGPNATKPGGLGVVCPSCPWIGINLPEGWDKVPPGKQFLYMLFTAMDANFRLKNQLVSSYKQDPGLGAGLAYMVPPQEHDAYALKNATQDDVSSCVGFQAIAQANTRFSKGLRYTGVGAVICARSEMVLPLGVGNLQKGERFCNMDYIFVSGIRNFLDLTVILISYDIACQWFINFRSRIAQPNWPENLKRPDGIKLVPAIPKLHEPMHKQDNHQGYSLNHVKGAGNTDGEGLERIWGPHNAVGKVTQGASPGTRLLIIDIHFGWWNWLKYIGLGLMLFHRYRAAVATRNIQREAHDSFTKNIKAEVVASWTNMCETWDEDESVPKQAKNPFDTEGTSMTEAQVQKELDEEENSRVKNGRIARSDTPPHAFVTMALNIENTQRQLLSQIKSKALPLEGKKSLRDQRLRLSEAIKAWELLVSIYMPGLLRYKATLKDQSNDPEKPETHRIWLPSYFSPAERVWVCVEELPGIEEKLRTSHCYDSLNELRNSLRIKDRLVNWKNRNIRGQRDGTRSRAIIDRIHQRARQAAQKYRVSRQAKLALSGAGEWEKNLRLLREVDIRTYREPEPLPLATARPGTVTSEVQSSSDSAAEDSNMDVDKADPAPFFSGEDPHAQPTRERTQKDGTGESRKVLSWIWLMEKEEGMDKSADPDTVSDPAEDTILRSEWAKSRSRVNRAIEEVDLLKEEMRRILEFLDWKSKWWLSVSSSRSGEAALQEGLLAYATSQASLQKKLSRDFQALWMSSLDEKPRMKFPGAIFEIPGEKNPAKPWEKVSSGNVGVLGQGMSDGPSAAEKDIGIQKDEEQHSEEEDDEDDEEEDDED